ncbi:MAG: VCBS repeat-containing protein, partial [Rhodobacteraceae bacterium]|nr:VCBS repeat-containing protein [Paracoccaceae bacterium]
GSGAFCEQPGAVVWYENPGNAAGSWSRHHVADLWGARTIATADLTGNGLPDLIVGSVTRLGQPDGVVWYRHHSSGDPWSGANSIDMTLGNVETVLTHDVDGDAVPDILAVDYDGNEIVWFENGRSANSPNNNPTLSKHIIGTLTNPNSIAVANMDGDGNPDLLATSNSGTIWYEAPANPTNTWSGTPIDATFGTGVSARVVAADFDGDGDTDVAVSSNDAAALRWYENDSGWTSHDISSYSGVTGFATGDLDGNGSPDLITTTYANNSGTDRLDWWQNQ